jgi:pilus assembly protein Flp/PilA
MLLLHHEPSARPTRHTTDSTMIECLKTWLELEADHRAVTALEYALMAGLLVVAVLAASTTLGGSIEDAFAHVAHLL